MILCAGSLVVGEARSIAAATGAEGLARGAANAIFGIGAILATATSPKGTAAGLVWLAAIGYELSAANIGLASCWVGPGRTTIRVQPNFELALDANGAVVTTITAGLCSTAELTTSAADIFRALDRATRPALFRTTIFTVPIAVFAASESKKSTQYVTCNHLTAYGDAACVCFDIALLLALLALIEIKLPRAGIALIQIAARCCQEVPQRFLEIRFDCNQSRASFLVADRLTVSKTLDHSICDFQEDMTRAANRWAVARL
ncbi:MAG TPA: hypothetical protein VLZ74_14620 [Methylocella sp.]|nr:hypothetical protein [Methylocella sp.]